jgi:hypothetical protein
MVGIGLAYGWLDWLMVGWTSLWLGMVWLMVCVGLAYGWGWSGLWLVGLAYGWLDWLMVGWSGL